MVRGASGRDQVPADRRDVLSSDKKIERMRIRAKLSDEDRDFLDAVRATFPGARLTGLRFSDGEVIGNMRENESE